jgi:membrane protein DedA with SNARE-associated domain
LIVVAGSFIEEIFSPLPSFAVLVPVGAAAAARHVPLWHITLMALCAGIGRLPAALIWYWLAGHFEGAILKGRSFWGVSHAQVIRFSKRLGTSGSRDGMILFILNALPVFPTMLLSAACGFVGVPKRMFVLATFFGSIVNGLCYLAIGYAGLQAAELISNLELAGQIVGGVLAVGAVLLVLQRRRISRRSTKRAANRGSR